MVSRPGRRPTPLIEGHVIAVPLREGGWAVGVLARADRRGVGLGYFMPKRYTEPPEVASLIATSHDDAVLICLFGDAALGRGDWVDLGLLPEWHRGEWPVPPFVRRDLVRGLVIVRYDEQDLVTPSSEVQASDVETTALPRDDLFGSGAVELVLTALARP